METTILGLSGYARSGKDTAAKVLLECGWERRSFGDKIRDFLYALNPLIPPLSPGAAPIRLAVYVDAVGWERAKDEHPEIEPRKLLQRCGHDAGRKVLGQNVWIDAALRCISTDPRIVVTDCRFPNEAECIKDRGGLVLRVERPGVGPAVDAETGEPHVTETALDGYAFDHVLLNDGSPEKLGELVAGVVRLHGYGHAAPPCVSPRQ